MAKRRLQVGNSISCSKCKDLKDKSEFYFRYDKKHLLQSRCKDCVIEDSSQSARRYIKRLKAKQKEYHQKNREKRIAYSKNYNQSVYRAIRVVRDREKYNTDLHFRMRQNLANRLRGALKRNTKSSSTYTLIGCSLQELKVHLESLFKEGMSWENYGEWQIDHKIPCASFDLSLPEQQILCFNYKNLQPLWALENLIKKDKIEKEVCHR